MAAILKTAIHKGTWLGKPGVSTTHHLDKSRIGVRICVMEMENEVPRVRIIKGDGRGQQCQIQREAFVPKEKIGETVAEFAASV